jgi:hypothetical protein
MADRRDRHERTLCRTPTSCTASARYGAGLPAHRLADHHVVLRPGGCGRLAQTFPATRGLALPAELSGRQPSGAADGQATNGSGSFQSPLLFSTPACGSPPAALRPGNDTTGGGDTPQRSLTLERQPQRVEHVVLVGLSQRTDESDAPYNECGLGRIGIISLVANRATRHPCVGRVSMEADEISADRRP